MLPHAHPSSASCTPQRLHPRGPASVITLPCHYRFREGWLTTSTVSVRLSVQGVGFSVCPIFPRRRRRRARLRRVVGQFASSSPPPSFEPVVPGLGAARPVYFPVDEQPSLPPSLRCPTLPPPAPLPRVARQLRDSRGSVHDNRDATPLSPFPESPRVRRRRRTRVPSALRRPIGDQLETGSARRSSSLEAKRVAIGEGSRLAASSGDPRCQ